MTLYSVAREDEERKNPWAFIPYSPKLLPCEIGLGYWQGYKKSNRKRLKMRRYPEGHNFLECVSN